MDIKCTSKCVRLATVWIILHSETWLVSHTQKKKLENLLNRYLASLPFLVIWNWNPLDIEISQILIASFIWISGYWKGKCNMVNRLVYLDRTMKLLRHSIVFSIHCSWLVCNLDFNGMTLNCFVFCKYASF